MITPATIYGVGLGPGDPELMSVKAARLLAKAGVIAHFRNPGRAGNARTVVDGMLAPDVIEEALEYPVTTEIAFEDPAYNEALREFYDDCVQRLRRLIDSLLDVTALETGKMRFAYRDYDLGDLIRDAIGRQPAFDDGRMRLVADLPKRGTLTASGDVERLSRALDQLLDNATKFTPADSMGPSASRCFRATIPNGSMSPTPTASSAFPTKRVISRPPAKLKPWSPNCRTAAATPPATSPSAATASAC